MRTYAQANLSSDSATSDINYAYISTKLWLMVAQRVSNQTRAGDGPMLRVWNELWPVFESITEALEVEARAGLSSVSNLPRGPDYKVHSGSQLTLLLQTLLLVASATIADLLMFLRNLRSAPALDVMNYVDTLRRLKVARGEADVKVCRLVPCGRQPLITFQVTRAFKAISEAPAEVSVEAMLEQAAKEVIAAEKVQNMAGRREASGVVHRRKETKLAGYP